jgi:hypothetical protein
MSDSATEGGRDVQWTEHEVMLWETARVVAAVMREEPLQARPCNFALSLSPDFSEVLLVTGGYSRQWLGALGDGSYQTSTTMVGGFGPAGIALAAATLGGSALGNARRKSKAAAAASVAWRDMDHGAIHVSTRGFYLDTGHQLMPFSFWDLQRVDLTAPGEAQWSATMSGGSIETFRFTSVCAEMVFALWALARCPTHPQFLNFTWLPAAFVERVRWAGLVDHLGEGILKQLGA